MARHTSNGGSSNHAHRRRVESPGSYPARLQPTAVVLARQGRLQRYYSTVLPTLGHAMLGTVTTVSELVEQCTAHKPTLVLAHFEALDADTLAGLAHWIETTPIAVLIVSSECSRVLGEAARCPNAAFLITPVTRARLATSLSIAIHCFDRMQALRSELAEARKALNGRDAIEHAKRIVMQRAALDENEAYHRLQRLSWSKNVKIVELAESIILADQTFHAETC